MEENMGWRLSTVAKRQNLIGDVEYNACDSKAVRGFRQRGRPLAQTGDSVVLHGLY